MSHLGCQMKGATICFVRSSGSVWWDMEISLVNVLLAMMLCISLVGAIGTCGVAFDIPAQYGCQGSQSL